VDSDAEISPDLSPPAPLRFSIGLLRRNRHLASPADDSDRRPPPCLSVPAGLSAITSPHLLVRRQDVRARGSTAVCEATKAYVVVR
jgi:hypothetical protein